MTALLRYLFSFLLIIFWQSALAFSPDAYARNSVLESGRWVKISVASSGLHRISDADLKGWGFVDPSKVRVYGYGGARIPDLLTLESYVDDLPMVQSEHTGGGIVFYAIGPERWSESGDGWYVRSLNPYSSVGYYFLSDREAPLREIPSEGMPLSADDEPTDTFIERLAHELDRVTPAESGHQLLGEDFRFTPSRTFNFSLPDRREGTDVWMQVVFYSKTVSAAGTLTMTVNGVSLDGDPGSQLRSGSEYGDTTCIRKRFSINGKNLTLGARFSVGGTVGLAHLDNISVNYIRELTLPKERKLCFSSSARVLSLSGADGSVRVWDVTSPLSLVRMNVHETGEGCVAWKNEYSGKREYAVWDDKAEMAAPKFRGRVEPQNLHGAPVPDMVIVTQEPLYTYAERIAELHRQADGMEVLCVTMEQVSNEFSSGVSDVNAIRRMLKMYYDRGSNVAQGRKLGSVLLLGAVTHDHRRLTDAMAGSSDITLPTWQSEMCISEADSYCSDDILAFLGNGAGKMNGTERMDIAVGRIPARSQMEAKLYVDRLEAYMTSPIAGEWRNKVMLVADDGDNGEHLRQTEKLEKNMRRLPAGEEFTYHKVYLDAYDLMGGVYEGARERMHRLLDEGVIWWSFTGHANLNSLTSEGVFTTSDLGNMYLRYPLFFYGATCTFGEWDGVAMSGLEQMVMKDSGGAIGGITAVRKVLISRNGVLTSAVGEEIFAMEDDGRLIPVGEALRRAKNKVQDENKLRFVLLGDPAMRLAVPAPRVVLESIDGVALNGEEQVTVQAMQRPRFHGSVRGVDGTLLSGFDGWVSVSLYDAERSVTTKGNGADGKEDIYDEQGARLYTGRAQVKGGEFDFSMTVPGDIADNFRNAAMSMYALADDATEAVGVSRDFYIYGSDSSAATDSVAPVIEYIYMDHESFRPGGVTDATPMLVARVSDDTGINMSTTGVGHSMTLRIDDGTLLTDVASAYIPDEDGTDAGVIRYRLPEVSSGSHTATLKVWDLSGNSAEASVDFYVDARVAPKIFDVYTDSNPVSVEANFYVVHNRPDAMLNVKIEVFDLSGRRMWESTTRGRADMYISAPVKWDLTGYNGAKVPIGIYVYKVTVSGDATAAGEPKASVMSKRLAVCSRR